MLYRIHLAINEVHSEVLRKLYWIKGIINTPCKRFPQWNVPSRVKCTVTPFWTLLTKEPSVRKKILLYFALYIKHTHIPFSLSTYIAFNDNVVCSLYVHQHWALICQLIVKIMFQMQTRELSPFLKLFICHIQQPMTANNVVYCYIAWVYSIIQTNVRVFCDFV
jgi:hypothetical protein